MSQNIKVNPDILEQKVLVNVEDLKLMCPFKLLVFGPSGSGKTTFCQALLSKEFYSDTFEEVYLCLPKGANQILRNSIEDYRSISPNIIIHFGIIDPVNFTNGRECKRLVIYEDLYDTIAQNSRMNTFMTFSSRKSQTSTIIISQNPYQTSRYGVTLRRQQNYIVAFSSEIDKQPLLSLGRQLRPQDPYFVLHCLQELSKVEDSSSYRYVFIDCHNSSKISKALKVRSNIFDKCPYVFILKD